MSDDKAKWDKLTASAKELVKQISNGDLANATSKLNDAMRKAMPGDQILQIWTGVEGQAGKYQGEGTQVRTAVEQAYDCVYLEAKFEKAPLFVKVVFSGDQIAGLQFVPQAP